MANIKIDVHLLTHSELGVPVAPIETFLTKSTVTAAPTGKLLKLVKSAGEDYDLN